MTVKTYKKLIPNPLWLGKGLTITDEEFTDSEFNDTNKKKLKAAIRVDAVEEIDAVAATTTKVIDTDKAVEELTRKLELMTKERDNALVKLSNLKDGDADAWITMSEEELAKAYTIPELRKLIKDNFDDVVIGRRAKEAELTKMLVGLIADANASIDTEDSTGDDEGTDTENPTGDDEGTDTENPTGDDEGTDTENPTGDDEGSGE